MKTATYALTFALLLLFAVWLYSQWKLAAAVRPPAGATTLIAFLEMRPQVMKIRRFVHEGKMFFEVVGKLEEPLIAIPSGPPAYIFDEKGVLVDWCGDLGDNPSFENVKWASSGSASNITREEAKDLVKGRGH